MIEQEPVFSLHKFDVPEYSGWVCYMYGAKPTDAFVSFLWKPYAGQVPNIAVRWFMRVCLGCTWVNEGKTTNRGV